MLDDLVGLFRLQPDIQVAGLLRGGMRERSGRPGHLFATDVSNPPQAFYERLGFEQNPPTELQARFTVGNVMHARFAQAIRAVDGVHANEAPIDGALVGVPGIRGRVDHCFHDSLLEFKTTPYNISTPEDLWARAPQYVAQLLTYAATWTAGHRQHLLVLMHVEGSAHVSLRVFRVRIKDMRLLRANVARLRDVLFEALDNEDPVNLGSCAYFDNLCPFQHASSCKCDGTTPVLRDVLGKGIEIYRDENLEPEFSEAWETHDLTRGLIPWELAVPRQRLAYDVHGEDWIGSGNPDPTAQSRAKLTSAIYRAGLAPSREDLNCLVAPAEPRLNTGIRWLKVPRSKGREIAHKLSPAIVRLWNETEDPSNSPKVWTAAKQVAAVAAYWNRPDGYILYHTPKLGAPVWAYQVSLTNIGAARDLVVRRIHELRQARETRDASNLPECPEFIKNKCQLQHCLCDVTGA